MSYYTEAGAAPSRKSKEIGQKLAWVAPLVQKPLQSALDVNEALEKIYELRCDILLINRFVDDCTSALKRAKGKKTKGIPNKMVLTYMKSEKNMATVIKMRRLVQTFDMSAICKTLQNGTQIEQTKATDAVVHWVGRDLTQLSINVVCEQVRQYISTQFRPTDVQRHLYRVLNTTTTPCAHMLTAPTGSGKTSGLAACATEMSSKGNKRDLIVLSTRSDKAMGEFIGVMCASQVPICIARRSRKTGLVEIIPITETMGKIVIQMNNPARKNHCKTILEMTRRLHDDVNGRHQDHRARRRAQKTFKTEYPTIILCEASFRQNGLSTIMNMAEEYVRVHSDKYSTCTALIDDFCASSEDVMTGHSIVRVMETCKRVILMTATPPADIGHVDRPVNIKRAQNHLEPFEEFEYKSTLGLGLELATLDADGNEVPYSILNHDLSVFDSSSFALQAMSISTTMTMLRVLLIPKSTLAEDSTDAQVAVDLVQRKVQGDILARNYMLSLLPNISLDQLRLRVIHELKMLTEEERMDVISQGIRANTLTERDSKTQTWVLDTDPIARARHDGFACVETIQHERKVSSWIDVLAKELKSYLDRKDKAAKNSSDNSAKCKRSKLGNSSGDRDGDKQDRRDTVQDSLEATSTAFTFPNLIGSFTPAILESLMNIYTKFSVNPLEVCLLFQQNILIITDTTPLEWIHEVSLKSSPKFTYGNIHIMGIGVHTPSLGEIRLPYEDIPTELLIQAIGRVGRPTQGVGKVIGTPAQFAQAFSEDYRHMITVHLDALSMDSVNDHAEQGTEEDTDEDENDEDDEDSEEHSNNGSSNSEGEHEEESREEPEEESGNGDSNNSNASSTQVQSDEETVRVATACASDVFPTLPAECDNWEDLVPDEDQKETGEEDQKESAANTQVESTSSHTQGERSAAAKKRRKKAHRDRQKQKNSVGK